MKKVLFTPISGYGHIWPSFAIAEELQSRGYNISFLVSPSSEIDLSCITAKGYDLFVAPKEPPRPVRAIMSSPDFRCHFDPQYFEDSIRFESEVISNIEPDVVVSDMRYSIGATLGKFQNIKYFSIQRVRFGSQYELEPCEEWKKSTKEYNKVLKKLCMSSIKRLPDLLIGDFNIYPFPCQLILGKGGLGSAKFFNCGHLVMNENVPVDGLYERNGIFITAGTFFKNRELVSVLINFINCCTKFNKPVYLAIGNQLDKRELQFLVDSRSIELVEFQKFGEFLSRSQMVIHHGGHGTTETIILNGVPQLIFPTDAKGRHNVAVQIEELGIGELMTMDEMLSERAIFEKVENCLNKNISKRCRNVASFTKSLGGPGVVAKIIENVVNNRDISEMVSKNQSSLSVFFREF